VTALGHPLAALGRASFAQVLDFDVVGLDRAASLQRFLAGKAAREGRPLRLRVQLRSFDAVCRMVECGVGVGIVPATTAARAAKTMALAVVDLTDDWAQRDLTIVVRAEGELRPYARALVESLRS
jgi:DNA-binding transcriptional LysR family regulator